MNLRVFLYSKNHPPPLSNPQNYPLLDLGIPLFHELEVISICFHVVDSDKYVFFLHQASRMLYCLTQLSTVESYTQLLDPKPIAETTRSPILASMLSTLPILIQPNYPRTSNRSANLFKLLLRIVSDKQGRIRSWALGNGRHIRRISRIR